MAAMVAAVSAAWRMPQLPVQRYHDVPAACPGPKLNAIIHDRAPSGRTVPGGVWTRWLAIRPFYASPDRSTGPGR